MAFSVITVVDSVQPILIVAAATGVWAYRRSARSVAGWSTVRKLCFAAGVVLVLAMTCGPSEYYGDHVYWVWLTQVLTLLLVAPILLLGGKPVDLARRTSPTSSLVRLVDSRAGRMFMSPILGPALIPVVCLAVLFGSVPGWSVEFIGVNWTVQAAVLALGCLIMLPLVSPAENVTSLAVGTAIAIVFFELLIDAIPGLVLRLSTHPASTFFIHRTHLAGEPGRLRDQQIGGAILWCVAELLDLPFLVLIFMRWVRADAKEAAAIDAELDDASSMAALRDDDLAATTPWFLSEPQLKNRLR